jgi:hypothetical protein
VATTADRREAGSGAGALFQSILRNVEWQEPANSKTLDALRGASEDRSLVIAMNVYGYGRDPAIPRYTLGT